MKKFLTLIYRIKKEINIADIEFRNDFDIKSCKCNPFISNPNRTYVWVEKLKKQI